MVNTVQAALHDREKAFNGVYGDILASVFAGTVVYRLMATGKLRTDSQFA